MNLSQHLIPPPTKNTRVWKLYPTRFYNIPICGYDKFWGKKKSQLLYLPIFFFAPLLRVMDHPVIHFTHPTVSTLSTSYILHLIQPYMSHGYFIFQDDISKVLYEWIILCFVKYRVNEDIVYTSPSINVISFVELTSRILRMCDFRPQNGQTLWHLILPT